MTRPVRLVVGVLVALGALAMATACSVSPDEEREMGAESAAQVESELPLITDTVVTQYVAALGRSMATHTSRASLDWRFAVVNSDEVNAFALPGGFVYVTRGLIEQSGELREFAGVMGHEIAHIVRRHSVRQLESDARRDAGLVLLCTLTSACSTVGGVIALEVGGDALAAQYSQRDEHDADDEGVRIAHRAGIDPEGLPLFLERVLAQRTDEVRPLEAFFATHPTDEARIVALRRRIAKLPTQGRTLIRDTPEFDAVRARVLTLPRPALPDTTSAVSRPE